MESTSNTINLVRGRMEPMQKIYRVFNKGGTMPTLRMQSMWRTHKIGLEVAKHRKMGGRINHTGLALCGKRYG